MNNHLLHPSVIESLKDLEKIFASFGIDCYLVGAVARDIWLDQDEETSSKRATLDVDIAVMMIDADQFNSVKQACLATGNFTAHPTEVVKLFYKDAIEIDLLPFGEIEGTNRFVTLSERPLFIHNMPGLREIYPFTEDMSIDSQISLKVCKLEGIVLLKLIAHSDRPERTKDIDDIEHILDVYFKIFSDEVYDHYFDTVALYDPDDKYYAQLVCARVIGRKIADMLKDSQLLFERVVRILSTRPTDLWQAMKAGLEDEL